MKENEDDSKKADMIFDRLQDTLLPEMKNYEQHLSSLKNIAAQNVGRLIRRHINNTENLIKTIFESKNIKNEKS